MKSAAVIGASNDRTKFGNKAVRAFLQAGFQVFPVHPTEPAVEGLPAYPSVSAVPASLDIVSIYVRPSVLLGLLPEIAAKGCAELWLNPGTSSPAVLAEAYRLGLRPIECCGILAIGLSPRDFS